MPAAKSTVGPHKIGAIIAPELGVQEQGTKQVDTCFPTSFIRRYRVTDID